MYTPSTRSCFRAFVVAFIALTFTALSGAQTQAAPFYPHDFADKFYLINGVNFQAIAGRLTGTDKLSTFSRFEDQSYKNVRVLVTIPAYTETGEFIFFSPLGKITYFDFTNTKEGVEARELARRNPIYVFPAVSGAKISVRFSNMRQAPVIVFTRCSLAREL